VALAAAVLAAPPQRAAASSVAQAAPVPRAPSAIIIDRVTGRVLYGRGSHARRPMASTTKIMTALLALERFPDLSRRLIAPGRVAVESGIGLLPGEHITVRQALLAMMLQSAQDAGATLAYAVSGSETAFVGRMNAKARALGLRDTHFTNACGNVADRSHYSSVYDLARLARRAMHDARFRDIVRRQQAVVRWGDGRQTAVRSNNLLLHEEGTVLPGRFGPARSAAVHHGDARGARPRAGRARPRSALPVGVRAVRGADAAGCRRRRRHRTAGRRRGGAGRGEDDPEGGRPEGRAGQPVAHAARRFRAAA
jgi:D-alanyl-D-alanine carboxypeptidase